MNKEMKKAMDDEYMDLLKDLISAQDCTYEEFKDYCKRECKGTKAMKFFSKLFRIEDKRRNTKNAM